MSQKASRLRQKASTSRLKNFSEEPKRLTHAAPGLCGEVKRLTHEALRLTAEAKRLNRKAQRLVADQKEQCQGRLLSALTPEVNELLGTTRRACMATKLAGDTATLEPHS